MRYSRYLGAFRVLVIGSIGKNAIEEPIVRYTKTYTDKNITVQVLDSYEPGAYSEGRYSVRVTDGKGRSIEQGGELDGPLESSSLTDLDGDERPEVVIVARSAGSGGHAEVLFFEWDGADLQPRTLPASEWTALLHYRGHDRFEVKGNRILRQFPIYREDDANCCPSGGDATFTYAYDKDGFTLESACLAPKK